MTLPKSMSGMSFFGITRPLWYSKPLRHPERPDLSLAGCQLIASAITVGASRVASAVLCAHAVATTPAGSMKHIRWSFFINGGLPRPLRVGSAS